MVKLAFDKIDSEGFSSDAQTDLIARLEEASKKTGKGKAKKGTFTLWSNGGKPVKDEKNRELTGWKFNEWDYGRNNITLPSEARGLFTADNRIVVRGYDKFFNIGELARTKWEWIEPNVSGPFEVTLKENGCILFLSGLEDGTLVVCSKHSTGPRDVPSSNGQEKVHSWAGQMWVEKHLKTKGLTLRDLAETLYELNATAVAELCDDEFEEHVLAYSSDESGIYLHGLNLNTPLFQTYPSQHVQSFADTFGFRSVKALEFEQVGELRKFLESCAETGQYDSRDVEGFVIRGKHDNNDYFFKYKFDEPYLMYRSWREVTRRLLQDGRAGIKINKHKVITTQYLDFVEPLLHADPVRGKNFLDGHGIIALRQEFLATSGRSGKELADAEGLADALEDLSLAPTRVCLIPVSTIGCGKTTLGVALAKLFPSWGHLQSDNISGSGVGHKLVASAYEALRHCPVVFLDRNNHKFDERKQIFADFDAQGPRKINFVCLNFVESDDDKRWLLTRDRVLKRGDNHQSIKVQTMGENTVNHIMRGFHQRLQPVVTSRAPDDRFDAVIDMTVDETTTWQNLATIVDQLKAKYPQLDLRTPSEQEYKDAFQAALEYKPEKSNMKKTNLKPQYVAVAVSDRDGLVEQLKSCAAESAFFQELLAEGRVQEQFHVTLAHVVEKKSNNYYNLMANKVLDLTRKSGVSLQPKINKFEEYKFKVHINRAVWNDRVFALEVNLIQGSPDDDLLANCDHTSLDKHLHITIGTKEGVRPMESGPLVKAYDQGLREGVQCIDLDLTIEGVMSAFV